MSKILVVDDEQGIVYLLENIFKKSGHEVITALDGRQALEKLVSCKPDLIFLDIIMPVMNGEETLYEIRKIDKETPVVMCSGSADIELAVRCMKYGAFDYVTKPFKNEDVLSVTEKALSSRRSDAAKISEMEEKQPEKPEEAVASASITAGEKEKKMKGEPKTEETEIVSDKVLNLKQKTVKKNLLFVSACLLFTGAIAASLMIFGPFNGQKKSRYSITYNNPTSITFDGKYLWVSDWLGQSIYKHATDKELTITSYYSFSEVQPTGIAFGDNCIWTVDSWAAKINCHNLDSNLSIKKTYHYPGSEPTCIFSEDKYLWVCDSAEDMIYKFLPQEENLKVIAKYPSPGPYPIGIFHDGKNIWTVDGDLKKVYRHNMDSRLTVLEIYKFPAKVIAGIKISGIGWDGRNIWISPDKKPEIIRFDISQLEKQPI